MTNNHDQNHFSPLVSVIIPVYNGSNYIKEAIDSVLAQTYKNIEIVIVNDGSTDNTEEIIKSYGNKLRYFKKENGGVSSALNFAIDRAKGEYISWLSHDDVYFPYKVGKQINLLSTLKPKERLKTIIYSDYVVIDGNSKEIAHTEFSLFHEKNKLNSSLYPVFNGLIHGCTLLIPKKCFLEIGKFDTNLKTTQDYDLWFKMFPKYEVRHISEFLIRSRVHDKQGSKLIIATEESDQLWLNMLKNVKRQDIKAMAGSSLLFYLNTLKIMASLKCTKAIKYIESQLDQYKNRNQDNILVTVIIPFHNNVNYTVDSINSVLTQTHKKLELLLVDDCSTEDMSKIKNILSKDARIKLIRNSQRMGITRSRNIGVRKAHGEYLTFLDPNDLFLPDKISSQLELMLKDLTMISHTSYKYFESQNKYQIVFVGKTDYALAGKIRDSRMATSTIMVHKDVFLDKRNFPSERYREYGDLGLWIQISDSYKIKGVNLILTYVRRYNQQTNTNRFKHIIAKLLGRRITGKVKHILRGIK